MMQPLIFTFPGEISSTLLCAVFGGAIGAEVEVGGALVNLFLKTICISQPQIDMHTTNIITIEMIRFMYSLPVDRADIQPAL